MMEDFIIDCECCRFKRVTYSEYDTGYEEWSCELLEQLHNVTIFQIVEESENFCPFCFQYQIKED